MFAFGFNRIQRGIGTVSYSTGIYFSFKNWINQGGRDYMYCLSEFISQLYFDCIILSILLITLQFSSMYMLVRILVIKFLLLQSQQYLRILFMIFEAFISFLVATFMAVAIISRRANKLRNYKTNVCIILGSGGHTTEICQMLRNFTFEKCGKVFVIVGKSDHLSEPFLLNYFKQLHRQNPKQIPKFQFLKTKRTNEVKQSKITSVLTTLLAAANAFFLIVWKLLGTTHLISNGPGICVPYFYLFWLFNKLNITKTKLIFIESWCRVKSLSTTGKIVNKIVDEYLVHWQEQQKMSDKTRYMGQII